MITIKELSSNFYESFMNYLKDHNIAQRFIIDEQDAVWIAAENSRIRAVFIIRLTETNTAQMFFLHTDGNNDSNQLKDGLIRSAFNSLNKQQIDWAFCLSDFYRQSFPLKDHFQKLTTDHAVYQSVINSIQGKETSVQPVYVVRTNIIYSTGCKGDTSVQ